MKKIIDVEWRLWLSVHTLAVSAENIKCRLDRAYEYHLQYVHCEQMPNEKMQIKLKDVQSKISKFHRDTNGKLSPQYRKRTCHDIADKICDLYYDYANFKWHLLPAENQFLPREHMKDSELK